MGGDAGVDSSASGSRRAGAETGESLLLWKFVIS